MCPGLSEPWFKEKYHKNRLILDASDYMDTSFRLTGQPTPDNRVTIVVNNGRVSEAYASDPNLIVDVLDKDTDDPKVAQEIQEESNYLDDQVAAGNLYSVGVG